MSSVVDIYTRECLASVVDSCFGGDEVAAVLSDLRDEQGLPPRITVDNAHVEAFHGTFRRECLSQHWFLKLEEARRTIQSWKEDYNKNRPHCSLGQLRLSRR